MYLCRKYSSFVFQRILPVYVHNCSFQKHSKTLRLASSALRWQTKINYFATSNGFLDNTTPNRSKDVNLIVKNLRKKNFDKDEILEQLEKADENELISLLDTVGSLILNENKFKILQIFLTNLMENIHELNYKESSYEKLIKFCSYNKIVLNVDKIVDNIQAPSLDTLKLLLENVGLVGNVTGCLKILTIIKDNGYAVDEQIFNYLISCYTLKGGLVMGESMIKTMQVAKIELSERTHFALINGLAQRDDVEAFKIALEKYLIRNWDAKLLLKICDTLAFSEHYFWLKYILPNVDDTLLSNVEFIQNVENFCLKLVNFKRYDSAFGIYKMFIKSQDRYGFSILKEMLLTGAPIEKLTEFIKDLENSQLNIFILRDITYVALKKGIHEIALKLFENFHETKPHFYWPILINNFKNKGENGLLETIKYLNENKKKLDSESLLNYVLPFFDLKDPQRVFNLLQNRGYTARELLSPILAVLLNKGKKRLIIECFEKYDLQIGNDLYLMESLTNYWINKGDNEVCVKILQKICESNSTNEVENFLQLIVHKLKTKSLKKFLSLLNTIKATKLKISSVGAENLISLIRHKFNGAENLNEAQELIEDILDFNKKPAVLNLHPNDMNIEQLECHLEELKSKNMNTRGVLRKLIQKHTSSGNPKRVEQLEQEVHAWGHQFSPGMLSSLLYTCVKENRTVEAMDMYDRIKINYPDFKIDHFKIVDLAGLLCRNNQFENAKEILNNEKLKAFGGRGIERNCKELLSSIDNSEQQLEMFDLLVSKGYCVANNFILGAIMELNIERDKIEDAVSLYEKFAKKYECTPFQFKLACVLIENHENELIKRWYKITESVHGEAATREALISAHCEIGNVSPVFNLINESSCDISKNIRNRCDRWIKEGKVDALKNLLRVARSFKSFDVSKIQLSVMKIYCNNNDCEGALNFWEEVLNQEEYFSVELEDELFNLLKRCKYDVPEKLLNSRINKS